jgi:BirA family transcriptional regulator, biotin operon repressor / biotin---[acetyl-CoA-carboxylase] ligase
VKEFKHALFDDCFWYSKINSTSSQALKLINDRDVSGHFLVIADTQTNGHGRKGNSWISPEGGIWMTAAFHGLPEQSNFTILIGNCIHKSLLDLFPQMQDQLTLKWPNDLMLNGLKLAGILTEHFPSTSYTLVGIGIDTNIYEFTEELVSRATSLFQYIGSNVDNQLIITKVFDTISMHLPQYLENGILDQIEYQNHYSYLKSKQIEIVTDFGSYNGICLGLNREGALMLQMDSGLKQPFFSGTVNILSP